MVRATLDVPGAADIIHPAIKPCLLGRGHERPSRTGWSSTPILEDP